MARRRPYHFYPRFDTLEDRYNPAPVTVTVGGKSNIYGAGLTTPPSPGGGGGGVLPPVISLSAIGDPARIEFPAVSGSVSGFVGSGNFNGPDGGGFFGGKTIVPSHKGISGIRDDNAVMFLVGVFLGPGGQPAAAPAALNVSTANANLTVSPLLGQQFFVGNGKAGAGVLQNAVVPAGAAKLYLGFAEGLGFGQNNPPGYYDDNGGSFSVTVDPAPYGTNTAEGPDAAVVFSPADQSVPLTATVDGPSGPATGGSVTFTVLNGTTPVGTATAGPVTNGTASASYAIPGGTAVGTYTVQAGYSGTPSFAPSAASVVHTVTVAPGPLAQFVVVGGGQSAAANTPFAQPISVQSVDQYGNGVAGVAVVVTGPAAGAGATFSPPPASDAQGFTTFTVTANTVTGAYTVTLTAGGVAQTISLANSAGPPAAVTVVAGGGQSIVAGGAFGAITLSIADGFNNPVGGTGVTLTSTPAGVTLPTGLTTAADGTLTFTPTAAGVAGAFTVVATAGGVSVSLTSTVTVGPPAGLLLSGGRDQTAVVGAGFALPIRVLIADAFNNPVAGQPVTVTGPTTGAGGAFSNPGSTDVLGFVSFTATANTVAGSYTIIVSSGSLTLLVKLTNKAASAAVVTVVSGDGQAIVVGSPATLALVYTVTDSFGNAVDPRGATFVSPPSGPAATVGPVALTGVPGQGRVTVAANSTVGNYTITLNAGLATIRLSFSNVPVPVVPPPPATPPVVPPPAPPAPPAPPDVPPVAPALVQALQGTPQFAVGTGDGGTPEVRVYGPGGKLLASFLAFDASTPGGSRAAAADFSNSGRFDIVAGTGPGTPNRVRVLDGATGAVKADFQPFEETFTGGLFVTLGDLNGDGVPDLVVTPDQSGGPIVVVYDGAALSRGQVAQLNRFFGIEDPDFRGGARAAVGLVSGKPQVVVSAGFGGGPRIAVFDGRDVAAGAARPAHTVPDFFAFEAGLRNGAYVAAGDVAGTGSTNFIFGAGPGGGPRVRVLDAAKLVAAGGTYSTLDELPAAQVANFFAGDAGSRGGVRVAVKRLDATGQAGLVVGAGSGAGSRVTGYTGATLVTSASPAPLFSFDDAADFAGGVFVG